MALSPDHCIRKAICIKEFYKMAPRGRKTKRRETEEIITQYPIKYMGFGGIKDVTFAEGIKMLDQYGIPTPSISLNIEVNSNKMGIYQLVKHVLLKYEEWLLDSVTNTVNEKFEKRKTMFIKLIAAVTLRWYSIYRWKTYDRMIKTSANLDIYGEGKNMYERTCENLHIYQILWQEHCNTMKLLLNEWNEAQNIIGEFGLSDVSDAKYEMTDVMEQLNEIMKTVTTEPERVSCSKDAGNTSLKELLNDVNRGSIREMGNENNQLEILKRQKINEFQNMVNVGITKFEKVLESLSVDFNNLSQISRLLSHKMFKKRDTLEYFTQLKAYSLN